jgi:protein TonB
MPDNTSTPTAATDSTLLADEASGIYAPVRFTHTTPKQRYGWRAALIILVHALVLALVLLRLDLLASAPAASPEALDIIVVDLSGTSELAEAVYPNPKPPTETPATSTVVAPQPATSSPNESPDISTEERHSTPLEIVPAQPVTTPTPSQNAEPVPKPPQTTPSPPTPAPRTVPSQTSKTSAAAAVSTSSNSRQETVGSSSKASELITTPPRLDPAYLHNPAPLYPALSKRNRETGTVFLLVNVNPEGNATSVTLHQSSGYDRLDQAAIQAVTRWRFVPGMRGQSAISATVIVPISFKQP